MMKSFGLFVLLFLSLHAFADEGMWTLDHFPSKKVAQKYKVNITSDWLTKARLSSARLANGCSGSFVSSDGLIMTNHHCVRDCIEDLSNSRRDYIKNGFYAKQLKDELVCPAFEVNRLIETSDVTKLVLAATNGKSGAAFSEAQKAVFAKLEKECSQNDAKLRCDVVALYNGGQYHLYKYQRYQDVRLVFAPEQQAASFGGDPDNFSFPRYGLDVSFLRAYENGKPIANANYFPWAKTAIKDGDVTFVTGHPGSTSRQLTVAELAYERDVQLVRGLIHGSELRGLLTEYATKGAEFERTSMGYLHSVENRLKATKGKHKALVDKAFFAKIENAERTLRQKVQANPTLKKKYGSAWGDSEKALAKYKDQSVELSQIEFTTYQSRLFDIAKKLVRAADEIPKDNALRLKEYTDAKLPRLKADLLSDAPIYRDLETTLFTYGLTKMREHLTADHPFVKKVLGKKSPRSLATDLVRGTRLSDVRVRKQLLDGGLAAIKSSDDPMIQLALLMNEDARRLRKTYEDEIESPMRQASERIAQAKFAVYGDSLYPDATFSLRISYGQIKGVTEFGKVIPPFTDIGGAFARHTGEDPFQLAPTWLVAEKKLDPTKVFNFISTNDIIGGNSGSPMLNQNGEIIGLVFDGNLSSLGGAYGFDESVNRTVSVSAEVIAHALANVYEAERLLKELNP